MSHFFLTTVGEYSGLTEPRDCQFVARVRGYNRDDYMLVKIAPTSTGQYFNLDGENIDLLILSTVLKGETLFPLSKWPISVYVGQIKDRSISESLAFTLGQVEFIAKGFLYPTLVEAVAASSQI
jgi:hypothetical protein